MTRVKICGITRLEDAQAAVDLGAWALGFNFWPKSPRYISPENAAEIIKKLPATVQQVAVVVDANIEELLHIGTQTGIGTFQLHGKESAEFCKQVPGKVIKALHLDSESSVAQVSAFRGVADWILVDSKTSELPGGTGTLSNWELAKKACEAHPFMILAGGLKPENIREAIAQVKPQAVDVCSGVESSRGIKDLAKLRQFFTQVKEL